VSDRHEQFCWWLAGFLRSQGVQGTPNLATLDAIRAELASALLTGQLASDDGLSPRTPESLGRPFGVAPMHQPYVGVDLGSEPSKTVYTEWGERNLREPQVARAPLSVPERVAALEVQACNAQHNEKLSCADRQKQARGLSELKAKADVSSEVIQNLNKRLHDLEQLVREDRNGLGIRPEDITATGGLHPKVRP
jgi:hypothetical protein